METILIRNQEVRVETGRPIDLHLPEWNIIVTGCTFGKGVSLWANVNLYGCTFEPEVKIGSFVEIRKDVTIGARSKIEPFVFIPEGVTIGKRVFIGPHVSFTNDLYPKACEKDGTLITHYEIVETHVEDDASLGAGSVIRCGVRIGQGALVGAGSVVTEDIPANTLVYGEKAKVRRSLP